MKQHKRNATVLTAAIAVFVAIVLIWGGIGDNNPTASANGTTTTTEPSEEDDARECPNTWLIVQSDNERNRWFADGVQEIREADTPEKAREAANTWLRLVRRDPQLLAGASAYFTGRQVDPATLVDGKCASEAAETLTSEIELAIAEADVTPDQAPADGTNSGVDGDGNVVSAENPGVSGDRDAVKVVLKDGTVIWIMARCGNPVVKGPAPVPPGPTDEPPPTTTTTVPKCPNGQPIPENGLCPKDPSGGVLRNPEVPDQVKGEGTTGVGEDPGPARDPVDSPTGCSGACDEDDGFPSTTTTTQPNQGQGDSGEGSTNTTSPPTTEAPPPAPPTTESPSPSTTNPPPPPG